MSSLNKVILIGRLGQDPEVRFTNGGAAVGTLNLATSERWKDKTSGNWEERTEWHRVVLWGRQAELAKEYLSKGRMVYIEGRLQTRSWDDKDGQKKYTTEIVANEMKFLDGGKGQGAGAPAGGASAYNTGAGAPKAAVNMDGPPPFDADDDIPF